MSVYRNQNHIIFHESVSSVSIHELKKLINEINTELEDIYYNKLIQDITPKPIIIHIDTTGGELQPALYIYEAIRENKYPIYTVIDSGCSSAGSYIFLAGKQRYMRKYSSIMIHQHTVTFSDKKYDEMKNDIKNDDMVYKHMVDIYHENSNLSKKEIKEMLKIDKYMYPDDCFVNGFAHNYYDETEI
jgi:ATP-dependent protease ClpP protease subunit